VIDLLAPQVGLEPTTLRLTAECSTIELLRSNGAAIKLANRTTNVNRSDNYSSGIRRPPDQAQCKTTLPDWPLLITSNPFSNSV
jgi:hypothetical protein